MSNRKNIPDEFDILSIDVEYRENKYTIENWRCSVEDTRVLWAVFLTGGSLECSNVGSAIVCAAPALGEYNSLEEAFTAIKKAVGK